MSIGRGAAWSVTGDAEASSGLLCLAGELDLVGADELYDVLTGQLEVASAVTLDLSAVTFIDSTALTVLLRIRSRAALMNRRLVIVRPSRPVRRILELTGLVEAFMEPEQVSDASAAA